MWFLKSWKWWYHKYGNVLEKVLVIFWYVDVISRINIYFLFGAIFRMKWILGNKAANVTMGFPIYNVNIKEAASNIF